MVLVLDNDFKEVIDDFLGKKKLLCSLKLTEDNSKVILQISDVYTVQRYINVVSVDGDIEEISFNMINIMHLLKSDEDITLTSYNDFINVQQGTFSIMLPRESEEVMDIKVSGLTKGEFSAKKMQWMLGRYKALLPITKEQSITEAPLLFVKGKMIVYYNSILYANDIDFIDCSLNYSVFNLIARRLSGTCSYYYSEDSDVLIITSDVYVFICSLDRGSFLYDIHDIFVRLSLVHSEQAVINISNVSEQLELLVKEVSKQLVNLYIYKDSIGVTLSSQNTKVSIGLKNEAAVLSSEISVAQLDSIVRILKDSSDVKVYGGKNLCLVDGSQILMISGLL